MLKIFVLAFIICSVHSWKATSWTGRDWQSNSGGSWGGLGWGGGDLDDGGKRGGWGRGDGWGKGDGWGRGNGWGKQGGWDDDGKDQWAPAKYEYAYGVADAKTGDKKEQSEERVKDRVVGQYALEEPDGTRRIVKYEADDKNGFNAKVIREGKAWHPAGGVGWKDDGNDGGWGGKW